MSTVQEIEAAIAKLPPEEFHEVANWIEEQRESAWDRQIEADARNGRLEALHARLTAEHGAKPKIPLHEVLDDAELS